MADDAAIVADLEKIQNTSNKEGVQVYPGFAYMSSSILLQHGEGYQYPIDTFVRQIQVHENVYQEGILGFLDMIDEYNLIRNGIILGQELLYLKFCTSGAEVAGLEKKWAVDFYKHPLQVYKVEDMKERETSEGTVASSALSYRLHFCSPELLINDRIRISKTMQGTYADMVKDVLTNHLKTKKELEIEETTDLKTLIVPNLHPMELLKRITPVAQKETPKIKPRPGRRVKQSPSIFKGRTTDYQFWETTRGYKFLPTMRSQEDSEFVLTITPIGDMAPYKIGMMTALSHEYIFHGDTYNTIKQGGWGATQISHNAYNKSFKTFQSNYHRSLNHKRFSHVSETPVYKTSEFEKNKDHKDRMISDWPQGKLHLNSFSGTKKNTTINKTTLEADTPWSHTPSVTTMQRTMQTVHSLEYDQLGVTMNGVSILEAGMVVMLDLPDIGAGSGFFKGTTAKWENRLDNLWVITSLKHVIQLPRNTYTCELVLTNTMAYASRELPIYEAPGKVGPRRQYGNPHTG